MKTLPYIAALLAGLASASAQGTLQFTAALNGANEVPPTASTRIGSGNFALSGSALDYTVAISATTDVPNDVTMNGPALPGSTAPVLFDLGAPFFIAPNPPQFPWAVTGTINNLTSAQINDLLAGLWYVNVFSSPSSYPDGEIRGQLVPEPGTLSLLLVFGAAFWPGRKRG
jgi:hypothetical protein